MPRQMNLLDFLNPCATNSRTSDTSPPKVDTNENEVPSVIFDTPEPLQSIEHKQNISNMTDSPLLTGKSSVNPSIRRDTKYRKRRSSTFVRERQSKLQGKYSLMLLEDDLSDKGNDQRVRISAKMRRGNYDGLNYSPGDQLSDTGKTMGTSEKRCTPNFSSSISERSKLMVAKALDQKSKQTKRNLAKTSVCNITESEDSFCIESCDSPSPKPSKYRKIQDGNSLSVPLQRNQSLDKCESDALNDILSLLPDPKINSNSSKNHRHDQLAVRLNSPCTRQINSASTGTSHREVQCSTVRTQIDDEVKDASWDNSCLNLSDWSLSPPKVTTPSKFNNCESVEISSSDQSNMLSPLRNPQKVYRAKILTVEKPTEHCQLATAALQQPLPSDLVNMEINLKLVDSWSDSVLSPGDVIHLIPGSGVHLADRQFTLSDPGLNQPAGDQVSTPGCLVIHPDLLINGTNLVGSLKCQRRTLLQLFWSGGVEDEGHVGDGKEDALGSPFAEVMLVGSLVHELFQALAVTPSPTKAVGTEMVHALLNRPDILLQLYSCNIRRREMQSKLLAHVDKVLRWMSVHRTDLQKTGTNRSPLSTFPVIQKVHDVEESIWSSRFGIKGKIDLSLFVKLPSVRKEAASRVSLVPLELKTGRPSYSIEHKGQVYLYLLLLLDRYGPNVAKNAWSIGQPQLSADTASVGWLVYLQETDNSGKAHNHRAGGHRVLKPPGLVSPDASCFTGLLQARNQLASGLAHMVQSCQRAPFKRLDGAEAPVWLSDLTPPINETHICRTCPVQLACGLLHSLSDRKARGQAGPSTSTNGVLKLLSEKCSHLVGGQEVRDTDSALQFFAHWSHLLSLEYVNSTRQEQIVTDIVTMSDRSARDRNFPGAHRTNPCLRNLILSSSKCEDGGCTIFPRWQSVLATAESATESFNRHFQPGDLVLVSSDDGEHVGVGLATVCASGEGKEASQSDEGAISPVATGAQRLVISTDRPLPVWIQRFRVDRHVSPKVMQLNMSNLVGLMQHSPLADRLRRLVVDRSPPTFTVSLSKSLVQSSRLCSITVHPPFAPSVNILHSLPNPSVRALMKPLNTCQRTAVLRVLMANDYVLVQGYPGTGKTQTLVVLLRVLIQLNMKTLVVAHTHSAVDNLFNRLLDAGEKRILRLGSKERIPHNLVPFSLEHMLGELCNGLSKSTCEDPIDLIKERLQKAAVVGCTALAASGGPSLRHSALSTHFDVVLVDEASQLLLPTTLGPLLCLGGSRSTPGAQHSRFVLVGDPYQLPPLVQSRDACRAGLDQSLFTYLLQGDLTSAKSRKASPAVVPLTLQYRMNAPILHLANQLTYMEQMRPANDSVARSTLSVIPHALTDHLPHWLRRVVSGDPADAVLFLDTHQCCADRSSLHSSVEADIIKRCLSSLLELHSKDLSPGDIGVMAPYRCQVAHIESVLVDVSSSRCSTSPVEVNTVDQFQGRDKRVVLLSLTMCSDPADRHVDGREAQSLLEEGGREESKVENGHHRSLLDNLARLTVALTRAKQKLIIVGCPGGHGTGQAPTNRRDSSVLRTGFQVDRCLPRLFALVEQLGGHVVLPVDEFPVQA